MTLELYKKNTCPYCRKVMDFISSTGRTDIIFKDIQSDPEAGKILVTTGGKKQVPCLFIDGRPMYESLDIIKWLEDHPQA
ncbi:MAG: glutathione S-transferase N-terminal domain-containing protein [Blautia sp.]|nr:glutathione S-transferase N-terminal domain-containing protein [Blautia sp.]